MKQSKKELTPTQIQFIKENYLLMSINKMAEAIDSNFYQVRKVMADNDLKVTFEQIRSWREKRSLQKLLLKRKPNLKSSTELIFGIKT